MRRELKKFRDAVQHFEYLSNVGALTREDDDHIKALRATLDGMLADDARREALERQEQEDLDAGLTTSDAWQCEARGDGKMCQYNDDEDPAHDSCIHCGDPEERK